MKNFEVIESILNLPFEEPNERWRILEGEARERRVGGRFAHYYYRDPCSAIRKSAAERWVNAVNAEGGFGVWTYAVAKKVSDVPALISAAVR